MVLGMSHQHHFELCDREPISSFSEPQFPLSQKEVSVGQVCIRGQKCSLCFRCTDVHSSAHHK